LLSRWRSECWFAHRLVSPVGVWVLGVAVVLRGPWGVCELDSGCEHLILGPPCVGFVV
jgi:hypothetical protein